MEPNITNPSDGNVCFEDVYVSHFARLKRFAQEYVVVEADAENVVHDVFTDLWERWDVFSSHRNLTAFLFLAVKNRCIDLLRRQAIARTAEVHLLEEYQIELRYSLQSLNDFKSDPFDSDFDEDNLEQRIAEAIQSLPDRCREIFVKNKIEGKKHKDIADEMNISVKTVEAQMSIVYKKLREKLKNF